jgi:hypothetical protein
LGRIREEGNEIGGSSPEDQPAASREVRAIPSWLLAVVVPGIATACAYAYWVALAGYFGVPPSLVSVQPSEILVGLGALAVVFFYFNALTALGPLLVPLLPWWVREPYSNLVPIAILGSLFAIASRQSAAWVMLVLGLLAFVPLVYGIPLIHQRDKKGYAAKLRADTERVRKNLNDDDLMGRSLLTVLGKRFPQYVALFGICLMILALSYVAGTGTASSQRVFPVTVGSPQKVVVAVVGGRAFLREIGPRGTVGPVETVSADSLAPVVPVSLDATMTSALHAAPWPITW